MDTLKKIEEWQAQHETRDHERFEKIGETLTTIKENHLYHIENDMRWLKWLVMGIVGGIGAIFVAIIIAALSK